MRFRPIGIYSKNGGFCPGTVRASDFSNKMYEGVQLRRTVTGQPVIIMHSKRKAPMPWKVIYGFSTVFFDSFRSAVDFCNSRGMRIVQEQYK